MRRAALVLTLVLAASAGTFLRAGQGAAPSQTPLPASNGGRKGNSAEPAMPAAKPASVM